MSAADAGTDAGMDRPLSVRDTVAGNGARRIHGPVPETVYILAGIFTDTT